MKRCMVLFMVWWAACAVAQAQTPPAPFAEADAALHAATQRAGDSHALQLTGDLAAHDPTLIRGRRGDWFVFSTGAPELGGGTVQIRRSTNGREWFYAGNVFDRIPDWLAQAVPGVQTLWAPHVHYHAGTYYLYYSASTFGSNRSVIALATNTTLDPQDTATATATTWCTTGMTRRPTGRIGWAYGASNGRTAGPRWRMRIERCGRTVRGHY